MSRLLEEPSFKVYEINCICCTEDLWNQYFMLFHVLFHRCFWEVLFFFFTHIFIYTLEIVYQYLKYIHYFIMNFVIFCKCFFFSLIFVHNKKNLQKMFAKIIDGIFIVCVKLYMYRKHEKWILLKYLGQCTSVKLTNIHNYKLL